MRKQVKTREAKKPACAADQSQKGRGGLSRSYYIATGVETSDRSHPGLKNFVEANLARRVTHEEIARQARKRFGVRLSSAGISRHWKRRVLPDEAELKRLIGKSQAKAVIVCREAARFPEGDASKIIEALIAQQIIEDQLKLGEADIMKLAAEQRLRKRLEVDQERLKLDARRARDAQQLAEAKLREERDRQASVRSVIEGAEAAVASGDPFNPQDVYAKISAVISGGAAEERVESSE